jgi:hypothetical protein
MPDSATLAKRDALPYVDTWMNYAGDIKGRARVDVPDWSQTNLVLDKRDVRIHDARPIRDELSLSREGFILADHHSTVDYSVPDIKTVAQTYVNEVAELLKSISGADFVYAQATGLLKRYAERANVKGAGPSRWAHMDYTEYSAHKFVEWIEGWQNIKLSHYPRFAVLQTWRCISPPPQDNTLVMCDGSTIPPENLIVFDACMAKPYDKPGNVFESQLCKYDERMRWYYFPNMTQDELLVFKAYDTDHSLWSQPLHNSADIPGVPADSVPRCSIESRFFAFWK